MYYAVVLVVFCAFFSAFVAGRKGRSPLLWWMIGLLPVFGVVLALLAAPRLPGASQASVDEGPGQAPDRPKRCRGEFIPDCLGCAYFQRQLFRADPAEGVRGYCRFFEMGLVDEDTRRAAR